MGITYNEKDHTFHLQAKDTSYIFKVREGGYLAHLYWGKKVEEYNGSNALRYFDRGFSPNPVGAGTDRTFSLDTLPQEYPSYGTTDFRTPAFQVQLENGTTITDLRYESHTIIKGKPALEGLPSTYVEAEDEAWTLEILLTDAVIGLHATVAYTVFSNFNAITRSVRLHNKGTENLKILKVSSMNVDFHEADFDLVTLPGAHIRERYISRAPVREGVQSIESRRGASSHQQNPFMALVRKNTDECHGEVFAFNFVYSGNFLGLVEVDQFQQTRVNMGINPFDFSWLLMPGESFQSPEVVMVYADNGFNDMSNTFHKLYRTRLCRGDFRDKERPVLINNWEATYFDFKEDKIVEIAEQSKALGIELFVLDDGWFGKRDDDFTSLGDWVVDRDKLPNGMKHLAEKVKAMDMQFGLWFEPEMISEESDLYREHPDWCIHVPDRGLSTGRSQLILDLSREEVCQNIIGQLSDILSNAPISYVKWDMNRHMTEIGSAALPANRQRETAHRYMLGLYKVMEELTTAFPHILFESCSGGGGRFDPGMLYYMPQVWTSDNTDAISRLKIQYGTSLVYPISTMGAHVSAVPNHQVHRTTSLKTRGHVAMSGNFGYELDVTELTESERKQVSQQTAFYKRNRGLIQFGDFYRLKSPFNGEDAAWIFVSPNKEEAVFVYVTILAEPAPAFKKIKLIGLDERKSYYIEEINQHYNGDELMNIGLNIPLLEGDFQSIMWKLSTT
ncbi:alpha-galactosidase [Salipaludibacillus sp. LMS25]|jgi:alpha-galactosidase|uniref:alpha-galactosidase n=1 Tax=Salipaludibacillus sp. LMS25 TaxID=2924031 RepID=UPI0020D1CC21|nr:alpha-galactosidase [Salipaludibacillus sp. LMS25]UTR16099.1 alpha-galactosidase [Salipaludibacillus sp. LMS25]